MVDEKSSRVLYQHSATILLIGFRNIFQAFGEARAKDLHARVPGSMAKKARGRRGPSIRDIRHLLLKCVTKYRDSYSYSPGHKLTGCFVEFK